MASPGSDNCLFFDGEVTQTFKIFIFGKDTTFRKQLRQVQDTVYTMNELGDTKLDQLVGQWLELDKNESTRQEIKSLHEKNDKEELARRLETRIAFGTAGLRAPMEAGFSRLNSVTIIQASQGLAAHLLSLDSTDSGKAQGVVIGHDHRHNSEEFAKLTATAFVNKGIKVYYLDGLVHTPLVPFGVKHLKARAGIMITASHNPAKDNGYKVYWANACQIIPPQDAYIAASIEQNLDVHDLAWDTSVLGTSELVVRLVDDLRAKYLEVVAQLAPSLSSRQPIKFVYTPMHGVGLTIVEKVVQGLGVETDMVVVHQQAEPNPDFPTVKFPNPEEKGALDLAIEAAKKGNINFVIANDPDADRFAAAERVNDKWHVFTGNQLGVLFASYILSTQNSSTSNLAMLCSTVSTQMLSVMAKTEGFRFEETLTGFKWLGNVALLLKETEGLDAVYAFEEAIGYMFSKVVPDKDGVSTLAIFLTYLHQLALEGITPYTKLEQLYKKYGYFETCNTYLISPDPATTIRIFEEVRNLGYGAPYPETLGRHKITYWRDLTKGFDSRAANGHPKLPIDSSSQMITCELSGGEVRFTVRASGTEPKIKIYVECKANDKSTALRGAQEVAHNIINEWFRPSASGLIDPTA